MLPGLAMPFVIGSEKAGWDGTLSVVGAQRQSRILPNTIADGDIAIQAYYNSLGSSSDPADWSWTAGFTELVKQIQKQSSPLQSLRAGMAYKHCTEADRGKTFGSATAEYGAWAVFRPSKPINEFNIVPTVFAAAPPQNADVELEVMVPPGTGGVALFGYGAIGNPGIDTDKRILSAPDPMSANALGRWCCIGAGVVNGLRSDQVITHSVGGFTSQNTVRIVIAGYIEVLN